MSKDLRTVTIQTLDCRHEFLESGKFWIHAIDRTANIKGAVVATLSLRVDGGEWAWINDLFVAENYRRMGVGVKLLERACHEVLGWEKNIGLAAGVSVRNVASRSLFAKLGYRHTYTWDGGIQLWSLRLASPELAAKMRGEA